MKKILVVAAAIAVAALGGCATYYSPPGGYYYYDYGWGYDGRGYDHRHDRGGRSEPGNEAGMYPARPDGRGGHSRGGGGGGQQ